MPVTRLRFKKLIAVMLAMFIPMTAPAGEPVSVPPEQVGLSGERLARLDRVMQDYVDQGKLAGVVTLIARHGKIAHLSAIGKMSLETGKPMRTDALFRLYSMTKPITSVALLILYEEGRFQLTDPAENYLPEFKDLKVFERLDESGQMVLADQTRKMTIQDLFRHTAGLGYGGGDTPVDAAYKLAGLQSSNPMALKELVAGLGQLPLLYQPGSRWAYSFAHDVQAHLVERLSGMSFDKFLQQRLFAPLGMNDTSFVLAQNKLARFTTLYAPPDIDPITQTFMPFMPVKIVPYETPEASAYLKQDRYPAGGTGLVSTAEDYFRFAQMLLNGGNFNGKQILGAKTVELMTSLHAPAGFPGILQPGAGYGLGVSVMADPAANGNLGSRGQFGWGGAASTYVIIDPVENMVSILMTQLRPTIIPFWNQFQTLVYQAVVTKSITGATGHNYPIRAIWP